MRWSGDVGIITGRYVSQDDSTVIQLWARARNGESVLMRIHGIEPWVEITPLGNWDSSRSGEIDSLLEKEDIIRIEGPETKLTDLGDRPVWRIFVSQPFVVPRLRQDLGMKWTVLSGDIPFVNRFFLDGDLAMHVSIDGKIGLGDEPVDVIVDLTMDDVQHSEPFPVPFTVFSFDLETSIAHDTILCGAAVIEDMGSGERTRHTFTGPEDVILRELTDLVRACDADIITGYNIDNFDLPRIADRANLIAGRNKSARMSLMGWGRVALKESEGKRNRDSLFPKRGTARAWNLAGRCVMDTWWQARQVLRPQRETLKFVSQLLFPDDEDMQKMDVDASKMDEEWAARPDVVLEYCLRDAELPLDIMKKIQVFRRKEAVAAVAKVSLDTSANGSTSQLIDSLVIRYADRAGIAVPLTGSADRKEGQITGGYVHDVEAGLHPWIAILDFKSMYPSIMIGKNICFTTRIDPSSTDQPGEDYHVSPTGAKFRNQSVRKGMVPHLLEGLMAQRDEHKAGLKNAKDDTLKSFHDQMQYAVKILMNSFYGVFASGFYRFTHRDLGSSITAWARHNIKTIINKLDQEGHKVVYSDTDSIFVKTPVEGVKDPKATMIEFGHSTAERFSEASAELEFEKGLSVFFSHGAKKRYVGQVVWPSEEMLVRGYETQRTDSFRFLTDGMKEMFRHVLSDNSESAVQLAIEMIAEAKAGKVPIRQLIMSKSCKGKFDKTRNVWDFSKDYANPDSMVQVRAARKLIEKGLPFTPGMKIGFIVINARNRPMEIEPWLEEDPVSNYDGQYYADRLATALGRLTEAFGWTGKELLSGNRQTSLFSF